MQATGERRRGAEVLREATEKEMRARKIEIVAPRGHKTRTVRALRDAGVVVGRDWLDGSEKGYWNPAREDKEVDRGAVVALAREGMVRIGGPLRSEDAETDGGRLRPLAGQVQRHVRPERLVEACEVARGVGIGTLETVYGLFDLPVYVISAEEAVGEILRRVGPAGEQALADEARYFESFDEEQYESSNHSGRDWRAVSRAVVSSDESAAILSYVEAGSYLHKGVSWSDYADTGYAPGGLHHLRFAVYLVVRDSTSGERHVIRVPPRFGMTRSKTWQRYIPHDPDGLIHAAIAWTFGLKPEEYHPDSES